jgi:hypothetical protein
MNIQSRRIGRAEDRLGASDFFRPAARHDEKAISLDVGLVLDHAVFRDADAIERGGKRGHAADKSGVLDAGNDYRGRKSAPKNRPQKPPQKAPREPQNLTLSPAV